MKNWQGIPTTRLTLGGEVMVPRDNCKLVFCTELFNYIFPFAFKRNTLYNVGSVLQRLFSTAEAIQYCGEIASVLWRLFSTVGG